MTPKKNSNMMETLSKMGLVEKRDDTQDGQFQQQASGSEFEMTDSNLSNEFEQILEEFESQNDMYNTSPSMSADSPDLDQEPVLPKMPEYQMPEYSASAETPYGIENTDSNLFSDNTESGMLDIDSYVGLDELYTSYDMKTSGVETIYLIESYMKTLPDTLPAELRRSIILKIVDASGFNFDSLLNDGIDRVSKLNEYSSVFASRTEEVVERHNTEIDALERQIQQIREQINERKNLHKRQFLAIESEGQRLKEVLDFITK